MIQEQYDALQQSNECLADLNRKKLFKKFQRLSARPTGGENSTGLGLAITKTLVEKLNGEIRVESPPGIGAEFLVELPQSV